MKKLFMLALVATMLPAANAASAQEKKTVAAENKGWRLGGQLGYWNNEGENRYVIAPEFGYDFNNHWAADGGDGFGLRFSSSDLKFGIHYTF